MTKNLLPRLLCRNNRMYIVQAAVEYHISLLLTGSFLAALTTRLGMSDALTGILSAVISLGCVFQLLSLLLRPKCSRAFVTALSVLNQLLFAALYFVPFLPGSDRLRIALFVVLILTAYFIYNVAHPEKVSWLMHWVNDGVRGMLCRFAIVLRQREVRQITVLYTLWSMANYAAIPFYGTYQIKELGFSLTLVSALSVLGCLVRALVSRAWGRYGDRCSFPVMVRLGGLFIHAGFQRSGECHAARRHCVWTDLLCPAADERGGGTAGPVGGLLCACGPGEKAVKNRTGFPSGFLHVGCYTLSHGERSRSAGPVITGSAGA